VDKVKEALPQKGAADVKLVQKRANRFDRQVRKAQLS